MTGQASPLQDRADLAGLRPSVHLTPAFRLGTVDMDVTEHVFKPAHLRDHKLEPVRTLLDESMRRYDRRDAPTSDAWLAPRLHAALRLSRREAGDRAIWRFLGLWAPDYVRWRFGPPPGVEDPEKAAPADRFTGIDYKQALARLWWMAEVFRDGKDYSTAVLALTQQDIVNNLFRMTTANHRPTALATLAVLPKAEVGGSVVIAKGRVANAVAKATNAAASTLLLDVVAPDAPFDMAARAQWELVRDDHDPLLYLDELPEGPDDGEAPRESVAVMEELLRRLRGEARVRGESQP